MKYRFPDKKARISYVLVLSLVFLLSGTVFDIFPTKDPNILGFLIVFSIALLIIIPFILNGEVIFGPAEFVKGEHDIFIYLTVAIGSFLLAQGILLLSKLVPAWAH